MGVLDGQPVDAAVTNPSFINKNNDDTMPNKLGFSRGLSGTSIADIQQAVNNIYLASGVSETTSGTQYTAPANTVNVGDNYQLAISKLARKFDPATGHMHTGNPGDAPPIAASGLTGAPLLTYIEQGTVILGATGTSTNVTSLMVGKTPSSSNTQLGVVVNTPFNRVFLTKGSGISVNDEITDGSGNLVYGKITSATGTWTISYFSLINGVETSYNFASAQDIRWFYRELFNPLVSTPNYNYLFELWYKSAKTVAASGATGGIFGDVVFAASGNVSLSQSGQIITINGSGASLTNTTPQSVGTTNTVGTATDAARADHIHQGVHSIAASGSSQLNGDIVIAQGTGITLSQVGQVITVAASGGGGVTSIAASGSSGLTGAVIIQAGTGISVSQSSQDIIIAASTVKPTYQTFATAATGTYTTPAGVKRITVEMVGPGGGGAGSATSGANSGNNAGNTVFDTNTANGGTGGTPGGAGGTGGSFTTGGAWTLIEAFNGSDGQPPGTTGGGTLSGGNYGGGAGGNSVFAGGGAGGSFTTGGNAKGNSGSGGGGGGANTTANVVVGAGGGAGAYIKVAKESPAATYSFTVGAKGTGGTGGTGGGAGGNGADGYIVVKEEY